MQKKAATKDDEQKNINAKQKTRNKKEAAQTRNKKRAKRINKASRRAAHKKPFFSEYFRRAVKYTIKAEKSEQSAQKAAKKRRRNLSARIIGKKQRNINAIRPFCACIDYKAT